MGDIAKVEAQGSKDGIEAEALNAAAAIGGKERNEVDAFVVAVVEGTDEGNMAGAGVEARG